MIKIEISSLAANAGVYIPRYYGFGKTAYEFDVTYYYIIPINFIVRFWKRLKWRYMKLMYKDKLLIEQQTLYYQGYSDGYNKGREVYKRLDHVING